MEKSVTLRFYDVRRRRENLPALADVLRNIAALPLADREARVGEDEILVRLENFSEDDGCILGQFVRGQSGNRPGMMLADRTEALPFDEPLGHGIAFRYRTHDGLLAIEYNPFVLSPSRVFSYLYEFDVRAEYELAPRMRDDAWQAFENLPLRKLSVRIAGHPAPAELDDPDAPTIENIRDMSDAYGAETVKIELSMGHHAGGLTDGAKRFAREILRRHQDGDDDVRSIRATVETGEGVPNDEINLMGQLFDVKVDLHFPAGDWERFYELRRNLLRVHVEQQN